MCEKELSLLEEIFIVLATSTQPRSETAVEETEAGEKANGEGNQASDDDGPVAIEEPGGAW